jgi:hypothetical protein
MSNVFTNAIGYTMDSALKEILQNSSKGKYPSQYKVLKGKIHTVKGNIYDIPSDPMDLCNLIHDIMNGQERTTKSIVIESSSSRSSINGITDDMIYSYALRECRRLGRDEQYTEKLRSCIYTALLLDMISYSDFNIRNNKIQSISGINTSTIMIEKK